MSWKTTVLGAVGAIALATGVYLAIANRSRLYPGLVIVAGCLCCALVLLIIEMAWSPSDREPPTDPP